MRVRELVLVLLRAATALLVVDGRAHHSGEKACATCHTSMNKCLNGAACKMCRLFGAEFRICECIDGYIGHVCGKKNGTVGAKGTGHWEKETARKACSTTPCRHGARCTDEVFTFWCHCTESYMGLTCEEPVDDRLPPCSSNPCQNGASCMGADSTGTLRDQWGYPTYHCTCPDGFVGDFCEVSTACDAGSALTCLNGGTCTQYLGNVKMCECPRHYGGERCEIFDKVDQCKGKNWEKPCCAAGAHGCVDLFNMAICECNLGFTGEACNNSLSIGVQYNKRQCDAEEEMHLCASSPCQNGGVCIDLARTPTAAAVRTARISGGVLHKRLQCNCTAGFCGETCEKACAVTGTGWYQTLDTDINTLQTVFAPVNEESKRVFGAALVLLVAYMFFVSLRNQFRSREKPASATEFEITPLLHE